MQGSYAILKVQKKVDILGMCLLKTRKKREREKKVGGRGGENTKKNYDNLRCIQILIEMYSFSFVICALYSTLANGNKPVNCYFCISTVCQICFQIR